MKPFPFHVENSVSMPGYKKITIDESVLNLINTPIESSYNVIFSRLFGLNYASFCRMVRDKYNATLYGKDSTYILFVFKNVADANRFQTECVRRWDLFIKNLKGEK